MGVALHLDLVEVLLLEQLHLLELLLVETGWAGDLALGYRDAAGEVGELVQLVEVLGALEKDLLVVC